MPKIEKPDRKFVYMSPLKDCENENACLVAYIIYIIGAALWMMNSII